jgi:hypothetical protein
MSFTHRSFDSDPVFEAFISAARSGDLARVEASLADTPGFATMASAPGGRTALMWAAAKGYVKIVQALLPLSEPGAFADDCDWNALMFAAANGREDCARALLLSTDPSTTSRRERLTPLILAALKGDAACVRLLRPLNDEAWRDVHGRTALSAAAVANHEDCLRALLPPRGAPGEASLVRHALDAAVARQSWACADILAARRPKSEILAFLDTAKGVALPCCLAEIERLELTDILSPSALANSADPAGCVLPFSSSQSGAMDAEDGSQPSRRAPRL